MAVFDGHGGKKCADFAASQIVAVLTDKLGKAGVQVRGWRLLPRWVTSAQVGGPYDQSVVSACITEAFVSIHDDMLSQAWSHNCGTTVAIALALGSLLLCSLFVLISLHR